MITLYNGAAVIASYNHKDFHTSGFLGWGRRGELVQPPGADEAVFKGDGRELVRPVSVIFAIDSPDNIAVAVNESLRLRAYLETCTSIRWDDYNLWRALRDGIEKIQFFDPMPQSDVIGDSWLISVTLLPKFARATIDRAETLGAYNSIKDGYVALNPEWAGDNSELAGNAGELAGLEYS